ncbi:hypothetical protein GCM10022408_17230 [Hymenobacter fastidiosus]|uniref:Secretion system C-terminal sorting domain-containing protein n=1 Tax=Hymenobacter fastidiosus TaxID=486264 RepID=A0ABP7S325_9BACT
MLVWALMLIQLSALAATFVVRVGVTVNGNPNNFSPETVTINPGDQVRWEWVSGSHPSVADDGTSFGAFNVTAANPTASRGPFNTLGTITYHCQPHSFQATPGGPWQGMIGRIVVTNAPLAALDSKTAAVGLSVYPNPSRGMVMVSLGQKPGQDYKLRLSNLIGREVRTVTLKPDFSGDAVPVNLSDLPSGIYFYSLLANDKVLTTKRLILQN